MHIRFVLGFLAAGVCLSQTDPPRLRLGPFHSLDRPGSIEVLVELPQGVTAPANDFQLIEDRNTTAQGKALSAFRNSRWTVSFILALDVSRSLTPEELEEIKIASTEFVAQLKDPVALVTFADKATRSTSFETSREELGSQISQLRRIGRQTRLYEALDEGLDLLETRRGPTRQRIIVISDGSEESPEKPDYIDAVLTRAEQRRVAIDTIWIPKPTAGARNTLVRLSERTDGLHSDAKESAEILAALGQVMDRVNRAVIVSFDRKLNSSGLMTQEVGIRVNRPGVTSATVALQIPASSPRSGSSSWWERVQSILGFIGNVQSLLALLGIGAGLYGAYTLAFVVVEKYHPEKIGVFPFRPIPSKHVAEITELDLKPDAGSLAPPKKKRRVTRVETSPEAAPVGELLLQAVKGPLQGRRIPIEKSHFRIGADSDNDLQITADQYMSGHHAVIQALEGKWVLVDQGSRNGTFIDGQKLTRGPGAALRAGQSIQVGNSEFRVILGDHDKVTTVR